MNRQPRVFAILAVFGLCALIAGAAHAEPIAVADDVQPKTVKLGEKFVRTIIVTHPKDERYELKVPSDLGAFELLDQGRNRQDGPDKTTTEFRLTLSAFELGKLKLPAFTFDVTGPKGTSVWSSGQSDIEVVSSLPPDADKSGANLYDIRPPEEVAVPSYALLWAALAAIAVAVLAFLLFRWLKNRPAREVPAGPPLPLDVRTKNALAELRSENLPARGLTKDFYFRLSEILRGYVGQRFGVEALECTSSELLVALKSVPTPGLPNDEFATFLEHSDLVKFAKAPATAEDCDQALAFGYLLVDRTTLPPAPPDAAARKLS